MTFLSSNFTLDELTNSQTAARLGIDNTPDSKAIDALKQTCYGLEDVRKLLGNKPILISSGYRSAALNKAVGGQPGSQHLLGQAVDFICPTYGTPAQIVSAIRASSLDFDQVILEFFDPQKKTGWCHISFSGRNRKVALVIDSKGTREYA